MSLRHVIPASPGRNPGFISCARPRGAQVTRPAAWPGSFRTLLSPAGGCAAAGVTAILHDHGHKWDASGQVSPAGAALPGRASAWRRPASPLSHQSPASQDRGGLALCGRFGVLESPPSTARLLESTARNVTTEARDPAHAAHLMIAGTPAAVEPHRLTPARSQGGRIGLLPSGWRLDNRGCEPTRRAILAARRPDRTVLTGRSAARIRCRFPRRHRGC